MTKITTASLVMGILVGMTFISIALYFLFFTDGVPPVANENIRLYALLTGSYGIWRLIRVFVVRKEAQKNV
jgi:uncharacterized protein YneF (UPF0154 family)